MARQSRQLIGYGDLSFGASHDWARLVAGGGWADLDMGDGASEWLGRASGRGADTPVPAPVEAVAPSGGEATITTDLADYAPGSTAYITMEGIEAGVTVRFEIDHVSDKGADGAWGTLDDVTYQLGGEGHDPWYVTDGGEGDLDGLANGVILTSWHVNADDSLNERFLLTGHVVEAGEDGSFGTADDADTGAVASNTFTDSGGDYSIDFSVGNPSEYDKKRPSEFTVFPSGRANEPIPGANDGSANESLSPKELALGQIVPFEVEIATGSSATFTGTMQFTVSWATETSNGADFGYDPAHGLIAAFVDGLDAGTTDSDSAVSDFTWFHDIAAQQIVATITVSNLDPNSTSIVELWVAIDSLIAPGTNGNVPARLESAHEVGTGAKISTGAQTVPLLKVSDFYTGSTDLSIVVSDEPGDTAPSATDDPEGSLRAGDEFTYTILAKNNSVDTVANGVVLTDVLDANVEFVSATINGAAVTGVYDSATHSVVIDLGFLERADSVTADFDNNTATALITVRVKDGVAPSTTLTNTATITSLTGEGSSADNTNTETTVLASNTAPVAANDTGTTAEDTTLTVAAASGLLANDSDPESQPLSVTQFTVGGTTHAAGTTATLAGGALTINADGSYAFVPAANFNGAFPVVAYAVADSLGAESTATLSLSVTPVNDAPVALDDTGATEEEVAVTIDVLDNDSDADSDPLSVTDIDDLVGGSAVLNLDGTVTFTPDADFNGTGGFTYTVSDGRDGTATAAATIAVAPVNDPPVALADVANTASDATVEIVATANDDDADGDDLEIDSIDTTGLLGRVEIVDGDTLRYDPNGAFDSLGVGDSATETFTYTVLDGSGGSSTASVTVTVGGVNDAPVAVDDTATTDQAEPVTIDPLANDSDPNGDSLTISANSDPLNGTLVFNSDGTVTYDPDDAFFGTDSFDYTISDGRGGSSTATATITVERNFAPSIPEPVVFFAPENQTRAAIVQAVDPEDDPVSYSIVGGDDAALFTIDAATGVLDFITAPDFESPGDADGDNRYQVRVGLQDALHSVSQLVTVNVRDVDDTPNTAPVITTNGSADMTLPLLINDKGMILDIDAVDLDGDTLFFHLFGEDAGKFDLDSATGELMLPMPQTDPRGSFDGDFIYELDVLVEDGNGGQATIGIDYLLYTAG